VRGARWEGDARGAEHGGTGFFVREQTAEAFARAIGELERDPHRIDPRSCQARADAFARPEFRARLAAALTASGAGTILPR
jgi:hypothetical protein